MDLADPMRFIPVEQIATLKAGMTSQDVRLRLGEPASILQPDKVIGRTQAFQSFGSGFSFPEDREIDVI